MSLSLAIVERLKLVPRETTMLVSGYYRMNSLSDIPYGIIQICIAFLLSIDQWDSNNKGKHLEISGS